MAAPRPRVPELRPSFRPEPLDDAAEPAACGREESHDECHGPVSSDHRHRGSCHMAGVQNPWR